MLGVFAVYWPVFGYGFVACDDDTYVSDNPHVQAGLNWAGVVWAFTTFHAANWHPLTWLSLMLDTQLFGAHAGAYHAGNVLFHAANTVLLFLVLKRMTGALWPSAFVAALFGFHPLHVESVAWISERKDVMGTFFFMLALLAYARYAQSELSLNSRPSTVSYTLALLFFTLGLMAKPMLVTLPFVLLLLDYWPLNRMRIAEYGVRNFMRLLLEKVPFFALTAVSCVVTVLAQERGKAVMSIDNLPIAMRIENALIAYASYIGKMLWPQKLAACYPLVPVDMNMALTPIFVLLLISTGVFVWRWRRPYLLTGWLWYLGTLVPVIGLVQVGHQSMADRYTYIPLIGLFIAITWGVVDILSAWRCRRAIMMVGSTVVLGACLTLATRQVRYWQNSVVLGRHALAVTVNNGPMEAVLGSGLIEQGKIREAGQHFAEALRILPRNVPALGDLALVLVTEGKSQEALDRCRVAIELQPHDARLHYILARILSEQGKLAEAIAEYQTALRIDPDHLFALNNLAWLLATAPDAKLRNGPEAVEYATRACQLTHYKTTIYVGTLAAAYAEAGRFNDAIKTAEQAIALANAHGDKALAAKNRQFLELYQAHKAYHQPAAH